MVDYLFDCGINLVDTGFQYAGHEVTIGKVLPKWREKVFIVDKWDPPLITPTVTKAALLEALDVSLERLNTTYIDCMMLHSIGHPRYGGIERIQNPAIYEAWDEAKKLKKIRFTGASSHGVRMLDEIGWGIDNDRFDVVLVGANFLTHGLEPLLKKARAKGVATMAMKTMTIYKSDLNIRGLQDEHTNARQAVLKWVLASDLFDTMIIACATTSRCASTSSVSGTAALSAEDQGYLKTVAAAISTSYCRPGCDGCYGACPEQRADSRHPALQDVFRELREQKFAMERYRLIPASQTAAACAACAAPCEDACRYKVRVRERLIEAHRQLTLA
jgi:predicted aldo/keto reductase-like oxidoreductase